MPERGAGDRWWGWGPPGHARAADAERTIALLERRFGSLEHTPGVAAEDVRIPPGALEAGAFERLGRAVGPDAVRTADADRLRHAFGQSYPELIRAMRGEVAGAPDAVLRPSTRAAVGNALAVAGELGLTVVPFGGGTSVTGGLIAGRQPYLALSLRDLRSVRDIDETSMTAVVDAGILGPDLEAELARRGLTLGHFPQSFERSSLGGWIATRSAGQQSNGYGAMADLVLGARLATPEGEVVVPARPPAAEGPDLLGVIVGSEGELGVITEATLRLHVAPQVRRYEGWLFSSFEHGLSALRELSRSETRPTSVRLSDEAETATAPLELPASGALLITGLEGPSDAVGRDGQALSAALRASGARALGPQTGDAWYRSRFDLPYLRDALLERALLLDVVETATLWSGVPHLYESVRAALRSALGEALVLCHVSHTYAVGASLYFTFLARRDPDWEAQWWRAKRAALDAIVAAGAVVSHHHGIGTHHREWLERRMGSQATAALDALRGSFDPAGILRRGRA